jgi:hypothetical protein
LRGHALTVAQDRTNLRDRINLSVIVLKAVRENWAQISKR